jgi:hypothetical protein
MPLGISNLLFHKTVRNYVHSKVDVKGKGIFVKPRYASRAQVG